MGKRNEERCHLEIANMTAKLVVGPKLVGIGLGWPSEEKLP
jgi:hypothetical protein